MIISKHQEEKQFARIHIRGQIARRVCEEGKQVMATKVLFDSNINFPEPGSSC